MSKQRTTSVIRPALWGAFGVVLALSSVGLLLKTAEMIYHCILVVKHRQAPNHWPVTVWLRERSNAQVLFRLPVLVVAVAWWPALMPTSALWFIAVLLGITIWTQIIQALLSVVVLGIAEIKFRAQSTAWIVDPHADKVPQRADHGRITLVFYAMLVVTTIVAYAEIYACIDRWRSGMFATSMQPLNALYFSTLTLAGNGDVQPISPWSKLVVLSELWAGMAILILLVFAHSVSGAQSQSSDAA